MMAKGTRDYPGAARFVPGDDASLPDLAEAAQSCQGCDLYERATQTVFGHGAAGAQVVLIGEQPGDGEDKAGKPFVGPAGRLLDRALEEAGISSGDTYTTGAVKHFRWKPAPQGGKRRIHQRPEAWQVRACWPWLAAELSRLDPSVVVTLGATAGQALFGSSFRVSGQRGTRVPWCAPALAGQAGRDVTVVPTVTPRPCCARMTGTPRTRAWSATCAWPRQAGPGRPGRRGGGISPAGLPSRRSPDAPGRALARRDRRDQRGASPRHGRACPPRPATRPRSGRQV
jgi:uracil-DNA glycosylase family protein